MVAAYGAVLRAIARSVHHTSIVWLDYTPALHDALVEECEDWVDASPAVLEYWGASDDGDEWRIHLRREVPDAG